MMSCLLRYDKQLPLLEPANAEEIVITITTSRCLYRPCTQKEKQCTSTSKVTSLVIANASEPRNHKPSLDVVKLKV